MAVETKEQVINQQEAFDFFIDYFYQKQDNDSLKEFLEKMERNIIISTLIKFNGNQKHAAKFLGIKYTTFNEKVKKYKLHILKDLFIKYLEFYS